MMTWAPWIISEAYREPRDRSIPDPRREDHVLRHRRGGFASDPQELTPNEERDGALHRALREARAIRECLVAEEGALATGAARHRPEPEKKNVRRRPLVVTDEIREEHVDYVRI